MIPEPSVEMVGELAQRVFDAGKAWLDAEADGLDEEYVERFEELSEKLADLHLRKLLGEDVESKLNIVGASLSALKAAGAMTVVRGLQEGFQTVVEAAVEGARDLVAGLFGE